MSKFLSIICVAIVITWFVNFDADVYHQQKTEKRLEKTEQERIEKTPNMEQRQKNQSAKPKLIFPIKKKNLEDVISGYGDPRAGGKRIHEGIDIPTDRGTPVLAVADGMIAKVANKGSAGKQVWLKTDTKQFFYAHLDSWTVEEGEKVKQGTVIGKVGNTGNAKHTLPHLHFGVYVGRSETIDPASLFE